MQAITSFIEKRKSLFLRIAAVVLPLIILTVLIAPTAFAQTTYVITDGDQVKVYTTFATDPIAVLSQAGVALEEDDIYTTQPGDGVSEITIQRNQTITINNCGQQMQVNSYGETLEMLLDRLGIPTHGDYTVSAALNTETFDGMEVSVDCVVETEQTYTEDIPFETVYREDPTMPLGQEKVLVAGTKGQLLKTANVVYKNSQQVSNTVIRETVAQQPVDRVVAVGTGTEVGAEGKPIIGDGYIITADGQMLTYSETAQFKATAYSHLDEGCDMITATGTTVRTGTIAVDPKVIPYGTRMFIVSNDGKYVYGIGTAEDCGGGIKGMRLDLYFDTRAKCFQFGVRQCTVYFLD